MSFRYKRITPFQWYFVLALTLVLSSCQKHEEHWEEVASFRRNGTFLLLNECTGSVDWQHILSEDTAWQNPKKADTTKLVSGACAVVKFEFEYTERKEVFNGLLRAKYNLPFTAYLNGKFLAQHTPNDYLPAFHFPHQPDSVVNIYAFHRPVNLIFELDEKTPLLSEGRNQILLVVQGDDKIRLKNFHDFSFSFGVASRETVFTNRSPNTNPDGILTHSSLPILRVSTFETTIPDDPKISGFLDIEYPISSGKADQLNLEIDIEIRGTTSQMLSKKSFSVDIEDARHLDQILGLPSAKRWALYGPYADRSLVRNALAYSVWKKMGHPGVRFAFCELVINKGYQGVYLLCEKPELSEHRLSQYRAEEKATGAAQIAKGDYMVQLDRGDDADWASKHGKDRNGGIHYYKFEDPDANELSAEQQLYIKELFDQFELSMLNLEAHTESNQYSAFINPTPFFDFIILNELSKNIDAYRLSTFLKVTHGDSGARIEPACVWDFNFAFGLTNYDNGYVPEGFIYDHEKIIVPFWWKSLMENKQFNEGLRSRYTELRHATLHNDSLNNQLNILREKVAPGVARNFEMWTVFSPDFWPNYNNASNHEDACKYLNEWLQKRMVWLDRQWLVDEQSN